MESTNGTESPTTSVTTTVTWSTTLLNVSNSTTSYDMTGVNQTDFYVGLTLAVLSSIFIGTSFIFKKRGLIRAAKLTNVHASEGSVSYLRDWVWWSGMILMGIGEVANFVAYGFAPATLVTPLGALSVIVSAVLSSKFLHETLNIFGQCGCVLCLVGSTMIVTNAPQDRAVTSMYELAGMLIDPAFLIYVVLVVIANVVLIFYCAPRWGTANPMVYVCITGSMGSLTVMSCKSISVAAAQLFAGQTEVLSFWLTWVTIAVAAFCITVQMNFLNRALDAFNTAMVTPILYIVFTTFVLIASALLFKEWGTLGASHVINILCGFLVIVVAIFLISVFKELKLGWKALVDFVFKHNPNVLHNVAANYAAKQNAAIASRTQSLSSADGERPARGKLRRNRNGSLSESELPIDRFAEPPATRSESDLTNLDFTDCGFSNPTYNGEHVPPRTAVVAAATARNVVENAQTTASLRETAVQNPSYRNPGKHFKSVTFSFSFRFYLTECWDFGLIGNLLFLLLEGENAWPSGNTGTTHVLMEPASNMPSNGMKPDRYVFTIDDDAVPREAYTDGNNRSQRSEFHDVADNSAFTLEDSSASRGLFGDRPEPAALTNSNMTAFSSPYDRSPWMDASAFSHNDGDVSFSDWNHRMPPFSDTQPPKLSGQV